MLLFVDNASYHRSGKVQDEIKKLGRKVALRYFLPYTPELNPTEGQWRILKGHTANTLYGTVDEMKESIRRMLCNGEVKVAKMSRYLT